MMELVRFSLRRLRWNCFVLAACVFTSTLQAQEFEPSAFPDRITLTWSEDPATTQTVTWRTESGVQQTVAQVRKEDSSPHTDQNFEEYKAATRPLLTKEGREDLYHHVVFRGLEPATLYMYRVGDGENWSEWFQFRTAEVKGSDHAFSFIYLGDGQNDLKSRWSRAIRQAFRHQPDARFFINTGDLINRAYTDREWGEFHHGASFIHSMIPLIATPGNHEYYRDENNVSHLDPHWAGQFTFPKNGPAGEQDAVYYIDYQNVRVIGLNTQAANLSDESLEKQAKWLEKVLADNPQTWTILSFHHPIYSTSKNRDNKKLRERLKPLFDQYGVDLVLQGHDHTYARGKGPNATENGPVYLLSVSGPKMYNSDAEPWMDVSLTHTQLYQVIHVSPTKLSFEAFKIDGSLFDSFEINKP